MTSDADLVRRARNGDNSAFGALVDRYKNAVYEPLRALLDAFGIAHERSAVDLLHAGIFYAFAFFRKGKTQKRLDARPSDALALALRTGARIEVHREVLDAAAQTPEAFRRQQRRWEAAARRTPEERLKWKAQQQRVESPLPLAAGRQARFRLKSRRKFTWKSSDPGVASVGPDGFVETHKAGSAAITAMWVRRKDGP